MKLNNDKLDTLNRRERDAFECAVRAYSTEETMEAMGIAENTVRQHRKAVYRKLGVVTQLALIRAYGLGRLGTPVPASEG